MSFSATYTYPGQDHTLGVLLSKQLLENSDVTFAAYKVPHPLTRSMNLRIHTEEKECEKVVLDSLAILQNKLNTFETAFEEAL